MTDHTANTAPQSALDWIPAPQIARELRAAGLSDQPVSYDRLYRGILSGAVPAEQVNGNRWSVRRTDLPKVAAALGLRIRQPVAA